MTGPTFQNTRRLHRRHNVKRDAPAVGSTPSVSGLGQPAQSNNPPASNTAAPPPPSTPTPKPDPGNQQPPPTKPNPNQNQNQPPNSNQSTPDPNQNQNQNQSQSSQSSPSTPTSNTQASVSSVPPSSSAALPTAIIPPANTATGAILNSRTGLVLPGTSVGGNTFNPSFATGASISPTATAAPAASGALSTGAIVGLAAGGLVAFGVLISICLWIVRRYFQGRHRDDDEDDDAYMRNSVHVEDEPDYYNQPRPPTMIERHFGAAGVGAHNAVSFNPGEVAPPMPAVNPFMTPMASPSVSQQDMNGYEHQQRQYITRNGSVGSQYSQDEAPQEMRNEAPHHFEHDLQAPVEGYASLERGSVTPFQAQQYAEIHRQLNQNDEQYPGYPTTHTDSSAPVLPEIARALSPDNNAAYNYPVPGHGNGNGAPTIAPRQNFSMPSSSPRQQQQLNGAQLVSIPENAYTGNESAVQYGFHHNQQQDHRPMTMYDEEDAYGGI